MLTRDLISGLAVKINKPQLLPVVYLFFIFYLTLKNPFWLENIYIAIPLLLSSIALMSNVYIGNRVLLDNIFKNTIAKWILTAFTYSICLWLARQSLSVEYGITPENLTFSAIAYAFVLSFPSGLIICGVVVYLYVFIKEISPKKLTLSSIASALIAQQIFESTNQKSLIENLLIIGITLAVTYKMIDFISLRVYREKFSYQKLLADAYLIAVATSFILTGMIITKPINMVHKKFIYLDAKISTVCGGLESKSLYIEKNEKQCYEVSGDKPTRLKLTLVEKKPQT